MSAYFRSEKIMIPECWFKNIDLLQSRMNISAYTKAYTSCKALERFTWELTIVDQLE